MAAPAGGAPPAAGAGAPPPPPVLRNYQDYYAEAARDPSNGNYGPLMEDFNVPLAGNSRYAPAALLQRTTAAAPADTPLAFVMLCRSPTDPPNEPGKLYLFHRLSHFAPAIGRPPTPWDDGNFALRGDLVANQAVIVPWAEAYFTLIAGQQVVPTNDTMTALLGADPNEPLLGPFDANDAGVELVRTRVAMAVPFRYVSIFLGGPLTPRQALTRVYGALQTDNLHRPEERRPWRSHWYGLFRRPPFLSCQGPSATNHPSSCTQCGPNNASRHVF